MAKKIAKIRVVSAGSSPDIDSDFHTQHREDTIDYVTNLYGKSNVANIVTFSTMAAKGALKNMCTIYKIPFKEANELVALIPGAEDGKELKLSDIFDENHHRYAESEDFRNAVSAPKWKDILAGAMAVEGKNKTTGVHACGIIISSKPLDSVIPMQTRKSDGRSITQWTYQECESLGLIKMDFLGLDTVDLIQSTVENIIHNGKTPPNMTTLIHGDLDDKEVFKMFQQGNSVGVFQFGSDMVRDLLLRMKPTRFDDLVACTAVARPGPMGMKSHEKYADRKNGLEDIDYVHPDFDDSELVDILEPTYGLCIYQEQITKIANQIAGMTLQEGDDLRKAMGKKKASVMEKLKPKFLAGGVARGFSQEAMDTLWAVLEPFSLYAFNKSHSVAYSLNAYQAAYLKVHYPLEFMAALIQQNISNRDKTLQFLQESKRMGIKIVAPNVNNSFTLMSPDKKDTSGTRVIFGLSAIKGVGKSNAELIVSERDSFGVYTSLADCSDRLYNLGISRGVVTSLIEAGALDDFHNDREAMADYVTRRFEKKRKNKKKGTSLFDAFGEVDDTEKVDDSIVQPYSERISGEANALGLYLSGHPVSHVRTTKSNSIAAVLSAPRKKKFLVPASCVSIDVKRGRGKTSYKVTIEDLTDSVTCYVPKHIVARWDKFVAQKQLLSAIENNNTIKPEILARAIDPAVVAQEQLPIHTAALFEFTTGGWSGVRLQDIMPLPLSHDGSIASRIIIPTGHTDADKKRDMDAKITQLEHLASIVPGADRLCVSFVPDLRKRSRWGQRVSTPPAFLDEKIIKKAVHSGFLDKGTGLETMKKTYLFSDFTNAKNERESDKVLDKFHRLYPVDTEHEFFVDNNAEQLPYLLEDIAGSGNYTIG